MAETISANLDLNILGSANEDFQTAPEAMELSREPSIDSLDLESFFIGIDDNHIGRKTNVETPLDSIWDVPNSPELETNTPVTPNMDDNDDDRQDDDELQPEPFKYHLRPQAREIKGAFTRTWMDPDKSGTYGEPDPNEERKSKRKQIRLKAQLRKNSDPTSDEIDDEAKEDRRRPKLITECVITLPFTSEDSKARYRKLVQSLPVQQKPQNDDVNFNGYKLRRRGSCPATKYYSDCNLDKSQFAPDLPEDLTGHPAARGCRECLALGMRCSLLDDERAWPCATCLTDDHDCELITQPKYKRACERCKGRRTACSYTYTYEHGPACQQCMDDGYACVAGPAKDTIRTRIRLDRDWKTDPLVKPKPFKARKPPNAEHSPKQSSLDDFFMTKPQCDKVVQEESELMADLHNLDEDPFVRDRDPFKRPNGSRKRQHDSQTNHRRHSKLHKTGQRIRGKTYKIATKFCHPIIFNHESTTEDVDTACHFCSDASYAIVGLEAKQVEVIEWEDGHGLEEVSGGHKGEGVENTRVCTKCTTERIPIIMCSEHELMPLITAENEKFDENDVFDELLSGTGKLRGKWCSVCANLAKYECCTPGDDRAGCGLLVCEHCMALLAGMYDGDLQKMLPKMSDEPTNERMFGLRADHELLKEDGLLMKYVLWSSQQ